MLNRLAVYLAALFLAAPLCSAHSAGECSLKSIKGSYGFELKGTNMTVGTYVLVGRFSANGSGQFGGTGIQSVNGKIHKSTFKGTYSVDRDCTGAVQLVFPNSGVTGSLYFVLVAGGREIYMVDSGGGTVESGSAKRQ
ncbi:MAG TPA: hypothetical protein VFP59_14195 [Candidatus Angelobacter sp.]|nr:hypothetical protein [Candidatus Angelobacter sp.]